MDENNQVIDIREAVLAENRAEAELLKTESLENIAPPPNFIHDCLMANERGDGTLFAFLHSGCYIYNMNSNEWLRWAGHHWALDQLKIVYSDVDTVATSYLNEALKLPIKISQAEQEDRKGLAEELKKKKALYFRRMNRLRSTNGAHNCLTWAHLIRDGGLGILGEELDCNDWLIACSNGVLELKTGRFRNGRPDDHLTHAVPHEWPDAGFDAKAPAWESFLSDIFAGNTELIAYVQRLFGYAITGLTSEHILPILHGSGRNGKGTLVETLRYVLGDLAKPIQSEMLLDQRSARASSGPSPDVMGLKGVRIAFASETDDGRRFSTSKAKWYSGGDTLTGRNPHDRHETVFAPTHTLFLLSNYLPHAPGDDFAFWQRVHLIPFNVHFVDKPSRETERARDKELPDKLKAEASGILAWLVRGCLEWQRQELNPPQVVLAATEQYRFSEDTIAEFLETCCNPLEDTTPTERTKFKDIYQAFQNWFISTCGDHPPKKKKFSNLMEKRFRREKVGGSIWFYGVSIKPDYELVD